MMVWGCFSGVEHLVFIENITNHRNTLNKKNFNVSVQKFEIQNSFKFDWENDPKQTS